MKQFMRREHADILKRQFMSIDLEDDIVIGLYNMHVLTQRVFSHQDQTQNQPSRPLGTEARSEGRTGQAIP